jgi:hypothetical protein
MAAAEMTDQDYQPAWTAGKPYGEPPDVGQLYEITRPRYGTFQGIVRAVAGHFAEVEITSGIARSFNCEGERGPGERVTLRDCDYFFVPVRI